MPSRTSRRRCLTSLATIWASIGWRALHCSRCCRPTTDRITSCRRKQKTQWNADPRGPADLVVLLPRKASGQPVYALLVAASADNLVDAPLIAGIDCVEGFTAMIEIEPVRARIRQGGREVALESR